MLAKEPSLSLDGKFSVYFTHLIFKDYPKRETPDWKVVWDERGHLIEPYTGESIGWRRCRHGLHTKAGPRILWSILSQASSKSVSKPRVRLTGSVLCCSSKKRDSPRS